METREMPRMVCMKIIGGVDTLIAPAASSNLDQCAMALRSLPGVSKKFLFYPSLPSTPTFAEFDLDPTTYPLGNTVTSDVATNRAMIDAMLANPPIDALTF